MNGPVERAGVAGRVMPAQVARGMIAKQAAYAREMAFVLPEYYGTPELRLRQQQMLARSLLAAYQELGASATELEEVAAALREAVDDPANDLTAPVEGAVPDESKEQHRG